MSQEKISKDRFQRPQAAILKINNKSFPVYEGTNTVGRNKEAIINVKHLNISQAHAIIVIINENHFISDLNSSNGTFLENIRVEPFKLSILRNNNSIKLGDLCGTYISQGPFSNNATNEFEMTQDMTQSIYGSNTQIMDNLKINDTINDIEDIHEAPTQEISWATFKIPKCVKPVEKTKNHTVVHETNNSQLLENMSQEDIHNCATQVICDPVISKQDQCSKQASLNKKAEYEDIKPEADNIAEEIHDAPTQVLPLLSNNSDLINDPNIAEDIHDAPTQVLPLLSNNSDFINDPVLPETQFFGPFNDEELPLLQDNDNYIEIHQIPEVNKTSDIHEAITQVVDISKKRGSPTPRSTLEDDEATDCEDITDEVVNLKGAPKTTKKRDSCDLFPDETTDCEDNIEDKPPLKQKNKNNFLPSDDDSNDSVEFFKLDRSISKETRETVNKSDVTQINIAVEVTKDNNSDKDKQTLTFKNDDSSDETIRFKNEKACDISSDSESDEERIGFGRTKKSFMVISTQDICENEKEKKSKFDIANSKKLSNQDNYIINDTDSETEILSTSKVNLEESIPATQDHAAADLNDTDCIPATQDIIQHLPLKSIIESPKNIRDANGSSEESFKLGLTELMINPSQNFNDKAHEIECNHVNKNVIDDQSTLDLYLAATQKITASEKVESDKNKILDTLNNTKCLYEIATQKIDFKGTKEKISGNDQLDETTNDIYFAPTQKVFNEIPEKINEVSAQKIEVKETKRDTDEEKQLNDIYFEPTQKVVNKLADSCQNNSREESMDELYLQPTQKVFKEIPKNIYGASTQKIEVKETKRDADEEKQLNDIYFEPTQKVASKIADSCQNNSREESMDELYLQPTQKVFKEIPENIYGASTQKIEVKETKRYADTEKELKATDDDIYCEPTQKVFNKLEYSCQNNIYEVSTQKIEVKETKRDADKGKELKTKVHDIYSEPTQKVSSQDSSREESMDDLYLQSTQQSEDPFNQPTQKVSYNYKTRYIGDNAQKLLKPNSIVEVSKDVSVKNKKKFLFKKTASNLDGSLTSILDHNSKYAQSHTLLEREDRSSIELEIPHTVDPPSKTPDRPSNPLTLILENASEVDDTDHVGNKKQSDVIADEIPVADTFDSKNASNQEKATKSMSATNEENKLEQRRKTEVKKMDRTSDNVKEERLKTSSRSLRTRHASPQTHISLVNLVTQTASTDKNKIKNTTLDMKPVRRRTTRRFSTSSNNETKSDLEIVENNSQTIPDLTDNSLNATTSEVNRSVALLESKITKTRKTRNSSTIQVKVPKNRRSMTISEIDDASELPENINNNIKPKLDQESKEKVPVSRSYPTAKKGGRPKSKQSAESEGQDQETAKKYLKRDKDLVPIITYANRPKRNQLNFETSKEIKTHDTKEETSSASSSNDSTTSKSIRVAKRKQLAETKSDNSDTSLQSTDNNFATPKKQKMQPTRQVSKRKQLSELKSDNSDSSIQSVDSNLVTPKKQKLQPSEVLLNTRERELRKQRPKVVFTMLESPQMESMIKQLGGSVIDSVDACTVLLTEHVKRSQKLLSAVGLGRPICSPKWITDSKKAHEFLDPWDYILTDQEAEKKWDFSLKESLNRSRTQKLLNSYHFQIMVTNAADVLKGAIESCGGKCLSRIPSQTPENTYIISVAENQSKYRRIIKQHSSIKVIAPEAIFDGVLRQELRFSQHYLT